MTGGLLLVGGAVVGGSWATVLWKRSARPRGQIRTSEYVTRWAGLTLVLAFCAVAAVLGLARALGGSPPRGLLFGAGMVMVGAFVVGLFGSVLRWWEPRADAAYRRRTGLPEGLPVRWQVHTVAVAGAVLGAVLAGVLTLALVLIGWALAPESTLRAVQTQGYLVPAGIAWVVLVAGCAGMAGYWQARRIRGDGGSQG